MTELEEAFEYLAVEARELYLDTTIPVLTAPPDPLVFYRQFVSANKPVLIRDAVNRWPALQSWDVEYLREKIGNHEVTVAVTPNGLADAVYNGKFILPEERTMTFRQFLDNLEKKDSEGVYYVQKQNSNFTDELEEIMDDAEPDISWASEAFGKQPDAVNFWMGDERAVTSLHKDHYENLYVVVRGEKTFTLYPPTDQPFIPYEVFPCARYRVRSCEDFDMVPEPDIGEVPWIPVDVERPDLDLYPSFSKVRPLKVKVRQGEMLYLPSLWYHHVRQSHACIAVNYWYDMEYDIRYNYFKFVEKLLQR